MSARSEGSEWRFTGWHMLAIMVLFFGIVIGVNIFLAISASRTWTGLVVENSYVASQEFNGKLANARAQEALGWHGGFGYQDGAVIFTLRDSNELPVPARQVIVALNRPIGVSGDQTLELTQSADGSWRATVELEPGVWNAAIVAHFANQPDYEHHARLVLDANP